MKVKHLMVNMRAVLSGDENQENFSNNLLALGEGRMACIENTNTIIIPEDFGTCVFDVKELQEMIYPNLSENFMNMEWLSERTILSPHNNSVNSMNDKLLKVLPGQEFTCKSIDTAITDDPEVTTSDGIETTTTKDIERLFDTLSGTRHFHKIFDELIKNL